LQIMISHYVKLHILQICMIVMIRFMKEPFSQSLYEELVPPRRYHDYVQKDLFIMPIVTGLHKSVSIKSDFKKRFKISIGKLTPDILTKAL
jgi:hypothetical protein